MDDKAHGDIGDVKHKAGIGSIPSPGDFPSLDATGGSIRSPADAYGYKGTDIVHHKYLKTRMKAETKLVRDRI